jgi:2,3-bisphosphoglycerate-dependent phosphoglycerate mutase
MAVGFQVGPIWYQVGANGVLNSFFSTVVFYLEKKNRGSRFPLLTKELYQGSLTWDKALRANEELDIVKSELRDYSQDKAIWDLEDLSKLPPAGIKKNDNATDLKGFFVTKDGDELIEVLAKALSVSARVKKDISIREL